MSKILVVDDEEHIRLLYSEELKEAGYEVTTAEGGYKLIERIEEEKPDLVILDIKMPHYNGLDILQDIRNDFYDLPVILSTAYDSFKDDVKSIAANFYVVKSLNLTELKNKIAMALETRLPSWQPALHDLPAITVQKQSKGFPSTRNASAPKLHISRPDC